MGGEGLIACGRESGGCARRGGRLRAEVTLVEEGDQVEGEGGRVDVGDEKGFVVPAS